MVITLSSTEVSNQSHWCWLHNAIFAANELHCNIGTKRTDWAFLPNLPANALSLKDW